MKGTYFNLKCGTSCLFIKLKLGRVGMGRVLHLVPSCMWAELVLGRVVLHHLQQSDAICVLFL